MVRAILDGRKTQTRRVVKLPHNNPLGVWEPTTFGGPNGGKTRKGETIPEHCAIWHTRTGDCIGYPGVPGDKLWVRETWALWDGGQHARKGEHGVSFRADCLNSRGVEDADGLRCRNDYGVKWKPSIFMPRSASRITLEVTGVRVERLLEITVEDAFAEGILLKRCPDCHLAAYGLPEWGHDDLQKTPIEAYWHLWDQINEARGFSRAKNPWTWVVEFKQVKS